MGEEGIGIFRFHHAFGFGERCIHIALLGDVFLRRACCHEAAGVLVILGRGVAGPFAIVPLHVERGAGLVGEPPVAGDHGHAVHQFGGVAIAFDGEGVDHAGLRLGSFRVCGNQLRAEHGRTLERGIDHAFQLGIDTENRLTAHDLRAVDAANGGADDAEITCILQDNAGRIRHGDGGRFAGEFAIGRAASRCFMHHDARLGGKRGHIHTPAQRRCLQQHLAGSSTRLAHGEPVHWRGKAAAGQLRAVFRRIGITLLDRDRIPVSVQFLGNQHGQHGLDALADFRVLADDGDRVVGVDGDEGVQLCRAALRHGLGGHRHGGSNGETATGYGRNLQEGAAAERRTAVCGCGIRHWSLPLPCVQPRRWPSGCACNRHSGRCCRAWRCRFPRQTGSGCC